MTRGMPGLAVAAICSLACGLAGTSTALSAMPTTPRRRFGQGVPSQGVPVTTPKIVAVWVTDVSTCRTLHMEYPGFEVGTGTGVSSASPPRGGPTPTPPPPPPPSHPPPAIFLPALRARAYSQPTSSSFPSCPLCDPTPRLNHSTHLPPALRHHYSWTTGGRPRLQAWW